MDLVDVPDIQVKRHVALNSQTKGEKKEKDKQESYLWFCVVILKTCVVEKYKVPNIKKKRKEKDVDRKGRDRESNILVHRCGRW